MADRNSDVQGIPGIGGGQDHDVEMVAPQRTRPFIEALRGDSNQTGRASNMSQLSPRSWLGFAEGDFVWTPCARNGFRRMTIVSVDEEHDSLIVEHTESGQHPAELARLKVRRNEVRPYFDYGPEKTWADNTEMVHLDDANILDNMRRRYLKDEIYTYTARVLLAVNPYKQVQGLYSQDKIDTYRGKNPGVLPPHPYAIADMAYRNLIRERQNQALVISGESGAGKTETAKTTMHYLTSVSRTDAARGGQIQDKIINSSPILESFGNASTVRNQNSSRFGKYNEMSFDRVGSLMFAGIQTYLLESSRVVGQQEGERNFHIFYEMLAGLPESTQEELMLDPSMKYRLLYAGNSQPFAEDSPQQLREKQKFEETRAAMAFFVPAEEQQQYWEVLAALIHLGEVEFIDLASGESSPSKNPNPSPALSPTSSAQAEAHVEISAESQDALAQAAHLLGVSEDSFEGALKWKERRVEGQASTFSARTKVQAHQTLQSIMKILYKRLFDKIVAKINESSGGHIDVEETRNYNNIGTLDIYGFERLQTNSFEQMCINLANERLQQFFIEEVLSAERERYRSEGLKICQWDLPDNTPVVSGIQRIMRILDEHSVRLINNLVSVSGERDSKFTEHVHRELVTERGPQGPVMALRLDAAAARAGTAARRFDGFQIRHYAGDVSYATAGWIDKNSDTLVPQVELMFSEAMKPLTQQLSDRTCITAQRTVNSVSSKYLGNLTELLATLKRCSVHYIRCFNPNHKREPGYFNKKYVLDQVVQCGTVELVKIMHHGFPNRCNYKDLRKRFEKLLPPEFVHYSDREFIMALMLAFEIDESQWTLGVTSLFLKAGQLRVLEHLRDLGSSASRDIILKIKMHFARKKFRTVRNVTRLVVWWKRRRIHRLCHAAWRATFIYVRLHRWLRTARIRLYGEAAVQRPDATTEVLLRTAGTVSIAASLRTRSRLRPPMPMNALGPQVFVALNTYEETSFAAFLQMDMNVVNQEVLKLWQRSATETVLFHDGRQVISARFSPKPFLRHTGLIEDRDMSNRCLDDLRVVDCHGRGTATPVSRAAHLESELPTITCMCQDRDMRQCFATCDDSNIVFFWKWLGTDQTGPDRPVLKTLGVFETPTPRQVFAMCFIPQEVLPNRIVQRRGHALALLDYHPEKHWLSIRVVCSYVVRHYVECIECVPLSHVPCDGPADVEVTFFQPSASGQVLILGGKGLLQFWQIKHTPEGRIELELIIDVAESYMDIRNHTMTSCLSLPPPAVHGILDWVVVGSSDGQLYGWRIDKLEDGTIEMSDHTENGSGRFRSNTHTLGVPIRCLVGTFGNSSESHHKQLQRQGGTYSMFLNNVPLEDRCFYSLADDGKVLAWKLLDHQGWTNTQEFVVMDHCEKASCHSSRLVPNVIVIADESSKLLRCVNRNALDESPMEACRYAGA